MQYVSATDAERQLSELLEAAQREPVTIRRHDRDVAVLVSTQEYERLHALNVSEFEQFCDRVGAIAASRGLTGEKLNEILADGE